MPNASCALPGTPPATSTDAGGVAVRLAPHANGAGAAPPPPWLALDVAVAAAPPAPSSAVRALHPAIVESDKAVSDKAVSDKAASDDTAADDTAADDTAADDAASDDTTPSLRRRLGRLVGAGSEHMRRTLLRTAVGSFDASATTGLPSAGPSTSLGAKGPSKMPLRARLVALSLLPIAVAACGGAADPVATPAPSSGRTAKSAAPIAPPSATAAASASATTAEPEPPRPTFHGKETVRAFVDANVAAFARHDPDAIAALYASRAVIASPGERGLEEASPTSMKRDLAALFDAFPDARLSTVRLYAAGHVALWEWIVRGTNTGDFMGHAATKKPIGYHGVSLLSFGDDGLVRRETMYFDLGTVLGQLGLGSKKWKTRAADATTPVVEEMLVDHEGPEDVAELTAFYAALDHRDDKALTALTTDDLVLSAAAMPADRSKKEVLKSMPDAAKAFPDAKTETLACFRFGPELAACETAWSATWKGPAMGMKPTGKRGVVHGIDIVRFAGSKIAKVTSFSNSAEMLSSFEANEAPPKADAQVKLEGKAPKPPKK